MDHGLSKGPAPFRRMPCPMQRGTSTSSQNEQVCSAHGHGQADQALPGRRTLGDAKPARRGLALASPLEKPKTMRAARADARCRPRSCTT